MWKENTKRRTCEATLIRRASSRRVKLENGSIAQIDSLAY